MEKKDPRLDPSISTLELLELSRKQGEKERMAILEQLRGTDSDINVKCDYLRNNPDLCTIEALQMLMDIINSGDYTFACAENGVAVCYKGDVKKMGLDSALPNILWVVKTHYLLDKERREREEIEEFVSKLPGGKQDEEPVAVSDSEVATESDEPYGNDNLGRDPMRWLFLELRRRGYIKSDDDTTMLKTLGTLTGYSYRQIYKNKNEELTGLAKRRMIEFLEELIEKLNKK